jgi:LysM repeat protein
MPYKKILMVIAIGAVILSACTMSYPGADATPIPTNPFTKPLATDKMSDLMQYATGTAAAKTAIAEGKTPNTPDAGTAVVTPTVTPTPGGLTAQVPATNTPLGGLVNPTNTAVIGGSVTTPTYTLVPVTGRPASYTLQTGEFPYCIARRFNVNPDDLLTLNGLVDGSLFMPGMTLKIPQTGSFPGERALRPHPTTYTVSSSDETFYSIACLFGDVDPALVAQANGIALGTLLKAGQVINIP